MEAQLPAGDWTLRQSLQHPIHSASSGRLATETANLICHDDTTLGPFVSGCRGNFDFTLLFEETVFSILPSACFLILSAYRLWSLRRRPVVDGSAILKYSKLVSLLRLIEVTCVVVLNSSGAHDFSAHNFDLGSLELGPSRARHAGVTWH